MINKQQRSTITSTAGRLICSDRPSVCLSVTFVHPTQIQIFGNVSTPFGTLAIYLYLYLYLLVMDIWSRALWVVHVCHAGL